MIAVAAFEETSVKTIDIKYIIANKKIAWWSTDIFCNKLIKVSPINFAVPLDSIAIPNGIKQPIKIIICQLIELYASRGEITLNTNIYFLKDIFNENKR